MQVIDRQYLDYEFVLSYRTRTRLSKLGSLVSHIGKSVEPIGLSVKSPIVFSINAGVRAWEESVLDIEFLVPVGKPSPATSITY
ncbi:MAG: hypothetical protein QM689_11615 [Oscillospiraceae bacterium]